MTADTRTIILPLWRKSDSLAGVRRQQGRKIATIFKSILTRDAERANNLLSWRDFSGEGFGLFANFGFDYDYFIRQDTDISDSV